MGKLPLIMYRCIFMFLLLCTSCVEQKDTTSIKIDLMATDSDTLYYSSFVDSLSYIPLETKDDCLIREITDATLTNQYIFILDTPQQSVWIYSTKGKFIRSLHHQGNGPGEYINLIQFEYDADNRELLLLDGWNKSILRYSPDDKFIDKTVLDIYPSDFKKTADGYLLSMLGAPDSIGGVYSYSSQNHKSTQLIKRTYNLPCNFNWELMGYDNEITFMAPPFDNIVYSYDKKGALRQQIPFKIYPLPTQSYTEDVSTQHLPDFIRTNYIESSHWLYATYWRAESGLRVFLYNKQNGDLQIGKRLVNDIDRVKYTYMTSSCNHNRFVFGYRKEENTDDNPILQILHLKN